MLNYVMHISSRYEYMRPELEKIFHGEMPAGGEVIYRGRNVLTRLKVKNVELVVKAFKLPHLINSYVYTTLRKSKARRSYENAKRMEQLGFSTPAPVAWCEERRGHRLLRSYYVSVMLRDATEMRFWERSPYYDTLLPAFAREIARLHDAGVYHRDFSPGNVLYTVGASDGSIRFWHVDLNRMQFGVKSTRRLMGMFRNLNPLPGEMDRLLHLYSEASGRSYAEVSADAAAAEHAYQRTQRLKRMFRRRR